ncbi:MAG: FAD-binding oxidoreductase [Peptococcaceae bacterium]|jgi:alkyldihydroxyacetonephosphate synthase|nr:FAD-binding oxidoreductase [Peptococcaceae bacterium]
MRRWNGWGDDQTTYALTGALERHLSGLAGPGRPPRDASREEVLARVPASRLPGHPLVDTSPGERLAHARGQSLPDWVATRSGRIGRFPDGVARPASREEVRELLAYAARAGAGIIPYGGGTSVTGQVNVVEDRPTLTVFLAALNRLLDLDGESGLATFQAGVAGPSLESQLQARGFTLGHYPQSFEYSTLGGWVATRSSGQFSLGYGRIERLVAGMRIETPRGELACPALPASAAGPDLKEVFLGSEGRYGIITEVTVRVSRRPEREYCGGSFLPSFAAGVAAVRELARRKLALTMLRLSTADETGFGLTLSGLPAWLGHYLRLKGVAGGKCLLVYGVAGAGKEAALARRELGRAVRRHGGVDLGPAAGRQWYKNRFLLPYLRNSLWEAGYAVDTLETAVPWSAAGRLVDQLADLENARTFVHLSHVYPDGCSVYVTCILRLARDPEETLAGWRVLKGAASRTILAAGGTISHQHGVGTDHREYLEAEKGALGLEILRENGRVLDPAGLMNAGKLF